MVLMLKDFLLDTLISIKIILSGHELEGSDKLLGFALSFVALAVVGVCELKGYALLYFPLGLIWAL